MKKTVTAILLALVLCLGLAACASDGTGGNGGDASSDRGTLTIDDITVNYQENATIQPKFSTEAGESEISYTFDGQNIRIAGNTVTGLVGNTQTEVKAKTQYHETTFTVNVVFANPFGANAYTGEYDDVFVAADDGVFRKTSAEYGEAYFYDEGQALAGAKYLLTGTAELQEMQSGAEASVIVRESATKYARFGYKYNEEGSYTVYSEYCNGTSEAVGYTVLAEGTAAKFDFAVMAYEGAAYFFFKGNYVGKVDLDFGDTHVGLGGENAVLELTRMRPYTDDSRIQEYIELATQSFGYHAYGGAVADPGVIVETDTEGVFRKTSTAYGQTFYYEDGLPLAGDSWRMDATVELVDVSMDFPSGGGTTGQATFMISKDDNNLVRFVMECYGGSWGGGLQLFSDVKTNGTFGNYQSISLGDGVSVPNPFTFTIVYHGGVSYFIVDGVCRAMVECDLGNAHFGFGGEACTIEYSNLHGSYDVSILNSLVSFGEHAYDGAGCDAGAFAATETEGEFEKTATNYQQMFLYFGGKAVAGSAYTVSATVELSDYATQSDTPSTTGQATFLICKDDNNLVRFVLEYYADASGGQFQLFSDVKTDGNFGSYSSISVPASETVNPLSFTIVYSEGISYFYLNDVLLAQVQNDLGDTHFGFGGEKCTITVSNVTAALQADFPTAD